MATTPVFIDTAALVALLRRRDGLHAAATTVMASLERESAPLVTSDWVLGEFLGGASVPPLRAAAAAMVAQLRAQSRCIVIAASRAS